MSKVWFELFELTFGNSDLCLKWGESVSPTTTLIKLVNNGKKPNTIGCKVDGRILVKASETLDLCHIEASKAISPAQKTLQDKAKLAIETKCTLDDILSRTSISASPNCHIVPNMQLSGLLAYVHSLKLVDAGLYTYSHGYDLSLPTDVLQFSDIMVSWCRKLKLFKATCQRTATIHTSATGTEKSPASQHLQMRNWVRGTFIPPASGPPHFPKNFLSSPSPAMCTTSTLNIVDDYELDTLQDGTIVQRRKRQQVKESSSEKRKSSTSEKAEKKHARHKKDKSIKRDKGKSKAE
ncbi:hypothetical protein BD408DRAFT_420610 [Parasitella parasitica]|nr:hypothetical protein BD408DRAFT_420610 [Parasitella parasitica]